ncbi:hypothetical protein ORI20_20715 [Mycobacterium sp. CVI_P3]|uniref:Carbohydrate binding module xylan-binding domain-containing protein n=1 Tax=Mycobacterium pinniadriaticum TaxID=2994102 RepID=A0ABT3SHY7_9MYCO|nr:carbohydrate-binding domain-containing protein [Mycobacterium pinniadriaticum]MCX2932699.1 hypothetical protein [Mycobacterium pinniadriaticum]MCX2939123.1 hypothetical protein [Mycobacterium pinniadriaticum]
MASAPAATAAATHATPTTRAQGSLLLTALTSVWRRSRPFSPAPIVTVSAAQTTDPSNGSDIAAATAGTTAPEGADVVIEAESLTLSRARNGRTYTDATASGGAALVLARNSSASTIVSLPELTSLVIRAKGDQFRGAPVMSVSVDGKLVSTVSVSATSWADYTIPFSAPAGTHTVSIAFTNDLFSRRLGDRNLRLDSVTVVAAAVESQPPGSDIPGYFQAADWLWKPISADAVMDDNSATWVGYLADPGELHIANLYEYAVTLVSTSDITTSTPRYDVDLTQPWGNDPFGTATVPIPEGTVVPPGSDGHIAVLDSVTGTAFGIWQAKYDRATDTWSGSWGGMTALDGDGIDQSGSATAANIARYAGVVTAAEFSAAVEADTGLNHALAFSTDLAGPDFVYPAGKSDGQNWAGVAVPIPEGYRIQLNPNLDIDSIPGITPGEKVIAKTLQTYGAYIVDQGSARMAFAFELADDATSSYPGSVWADAGLAWDFYDMGKIPWSELRVLAPLGGTAGLQA